MWILHLRGILTGTTFQNLKILFDPGIPRLSIYPKETEMHKLFKYKSEYCISNIWNTE